MPVLSDDVPTAETVAPCDGVPVDIQEVRSALAARGAPARFLLLDVRGRDAFAAGHIRGALCVPLEEVRALFPRLPRDRCLVTYGDDASDARGAEVAAALRSRGFLSSPFAAGLAEWAAAEMPVHAEASPTGSVRCSCSPAPVRPPSALRVG
jgi:rhodanese-related sulfurtransferase